MIAGLVAAGPLTTGPLAASAAPVGVPRAQPPAQRPGIVIPAYADPNQGTGIWRGAVWAAGRLPGRLIVIANPDSGPGAARQPEYTTWIAAVRERRGRVIGYVATGYGRRPASAVLADVARWYRFYPMLSGIFFDEVAGTKAGIGHYRRLSAALARDHPGALVVENPGAATLPGYLRAPAHPGADIVCTFEDTTGFASWTARRWTARYAAGRVLVIPIDIPASRLAATLTRAQRQRAGWVYVTDDTLPNPYDRLPTYWRQEVTTIADD